MTSQTTASHVANIVATLTTPACVVNPHGEITAANAAFTGLFRFPSNASPPTRLNKTLAPVGRHPSSLGRLRGAYANHIAASVDLLIQVHGRPSWFEAQLEPLDLPGQPSLITFRNANERIRSEATMQRSQAALQSVVSFSEQLLRSLPWRSEPSPALRTVAEATGAQTVSVYRFNDHDAVLNATWRQDDAAPIHPSLIENADPLITLRSDHPTTTDEFPSLIGRPTQPSSDGPVALMPLMLGGEAWGVVVFDRSTSPRPFSELDLLVGRSVVQSLAAAIGREEREERILTERNFVQRVLDGLDDGVWVSNTEGIIVFANRAIAEMLGLDETSLVGKSSHAAWTILAPDMEPPSSQQHSVEVRLGDRVFLIRVYQRWLGGSIEQQVLVATDISSLSNAERQLKAALLQAEQVNQTKTQFIGQVSHELRTPLQVVLGYARLIEIITDVPDISQHASEIIKASYHLEQMVSDLIDLSSTEMGALSLAFTPFDMHLIARDAVEALLPISQTSEHRLHIRCETAAWVVADRRRTTQILLNVLSNALKFSPPGSRVTLEMSALATEPEVHVSISDEGPGFPVAEIQRLFTPFERLSNAGATSGAGLGLALSRLLARRMGGELTATNGASGGALITLRLPKAGAGTEAQTNPRKQSATNG